MNANDLMWLATPHQVCLVDTGANVGHEDLGNVVKGWNRTPVVVNASAATWDVLVRLGSGWQQQQARRSCPLVPQPFLHCVVLDLAWQPALLTGPPFLCSTTQGPIHQQVILTTTTGEGDKWQLWLAAGATNLLGAAAPTCCSRCSRPSQLTGWAMAATLRA